MSEVNTINAVDGNQYLVSSSNDVTGSSSSQNVSFDEVFNSQTKSLEDIFKDVSEEYGVPIKLLKAVAQAESGFDTNAVSSCGASGVMQLMPQTAKSLGVEDVFDAEQNITGGAKMLAYLLVDYDNNTTLALAAYNAGSGSVAKYGGVPPFAETQNYIKKINEILGGELEADTTNISIEKNPSATVSNSTSTSTLNTKTKPVKIENTQSQASEAFSYERYLEFLKLYEKLATSVFGNSSKESDDSKEQELVDAQSEQLNFYELQQAKFNSRALSLLNM